MKFYNNDLSKIDTLIKRINIFLEDSEWEKANEYCEKVLDIDPENTHAYLGKLMAEFRANKVCMLENCAEPFEDSNNFKKVIKFCDDELKETLITYINHIKTRNEKERMERLDIFLEDSEWEKANEYCEKILDNDPENAHAYLGKLMVEFRANKVCMLENCAESFEDSNNFKKVIKFCDDELKETLITYINHIKTRNEKERMERIYNEALAIMKKANNEMKYKEAVNIFSRVSGYKDSDVLISKCLKNAEIEKKDAEKNKKIVGIFLGSCAVVLLTFFFIIEVIVPSAKYNNAIRLMEDGEYAEAILKFESLEGYKESEDKIKKCKYDCALALMNESFSQLDGEKAVEAYGLFRELGNFDDSREKMGDIRVFVAKEALKLCEVGDSVFFGVYGEEQIEIEWIVVEKENDKALLVSKNIIDYISDNIYYPYGAYNYSSWETSKIRKWMNYDFIEKAFTNSESAMIYPVKFRDDSDGADYAFLLDKYEFETYKHLLTDYGRFPGIGFNGWLLRTVDYEHEVAYCVIAKKNDAVSSYGITMPSGLRPALWIKIDS